LIALANAEAESSAIPQQIGSMKNFIEKKSFVGFGLATAVLVGINALSYPSFVTLRVFLLIKSFKETQYQLVEVSVVQIL
jgi:hypothetical protein